MLRGEKVLVKGSRTCYKMSRKIK